MSDCIGTGCKAAAMMRQIAELHADLAAARALHNALLPGYCNCTSTAISDGRGHAMTVHYATREDMDRAHDALCAAIDAALAGEKNNG